MPRAGGPVLAHAYRELFPHGRVLYLTGYADIPDLQAELPVLAKPFTPETLLNAVRKALEALPRVAQSR